ncbi:hypothetical protein M3193_13730 [Sporosarcina luteola]|uniref:hypothetical protein n=1 Tax=Sporosarcina luteola TaxID=582850 RepID=UPI002042249D|nr:hypothetical protein [Sporosarcina luteola]MCM3745195.1 hypothetical protein [Sporosarcina luteola]
MKRNYRRKFGAAIFLVLISLAVTGCSQPDDDQDPIKEAVKKVVELQLNAPDEKSLFENYLPDTFDEDEMDEGFIEFKKYLEETYKPYLTESTFEQYILTNELVAFHHSANRFDYQLKVNHVDVEQNEVTPTNYNFTVDLDYVNKDGEETPIKLTGVAIMRDDKIAKISYLGEKKLIRSLISGEPINVNE